MSTFTKTITDSAGTERVIERTTDAPGEITALRASGWEETSEKAPKKAAEGSASKGPAPKPFAGKSEN